MPVFDLTGQGGATCQVRGVAAGTATTHAANVAQLASMTMSLVTTGRNGAGAITATGAKVGDKVVQALNMTTPANAASLFESTITVLNQLQQVSASNLTSQTYSFLIIHQS